MQRVAEDLLGELHRIPSLHVEPMILRAEWSAVRVRAPLFLASLAPRLLHAVRPGDAVLFSSITSAAAVAPILPRLRELGVRTAAIAHGLDVTFASLPYQMAVKGALSRLDAVLPVSSATAEACVARGARDPEIVPNAIDPGRFGGRFRGARARVEPVRTLLGVGRLVPRKGFHWFVDRVMPALPSNLRFVLVGDGPERDVIERAVHERGLERRVELLGRITDERLADELEAADMLVMPNLPVDHDVEGFGVVILEAALAGLPSVVADLDGMVDVVEKGVTGLRLPAGDAWAWADAIANLAADHHRVRLLGADARARSLMAHGWPAVARRYVKATFGVTSMTTQHASAL